MMIGHFENCSDFTNIASQVLTKIINLAGFFKKYLM